jgi:hypothetical protein
MRKSIIAIALLSLFSAPTLASFAGETQATSNQGISGSNQAASSSGVSDSRIYEYQPPLSKEAQERYGSSGGGSAGSNYVTGSSGSGGATGSAHPAPALATYSDGPQAQVQTYVWTK